MRRLGRILLSILATIGLVTVVGASLAVWGAAKMDDKALPSRMVLTLDLDGEFRESPSSDPLSRLSSSSNSYVLPDVVTAIDRAGRDARVVALFATVGSGKLGLAKAQEIRDAVFRFRATGKTAVLFAETLGDFANGTTEYYLASAFGQVWLQPSGNVGLTGYLAESPFIKGTLDLLGIQPQFAGRYEFKSAIETFTEKGFSAAHRQNLGVLLDSFANQAVDGIAVARHLPPEQVRALMGAGPLLAKEALSAGLVDKLGYRDEALAAARGDGPKPKEIDLASYGARLPDPDGGAKIAVITGTGTIRRGGSEKPLADDEGFGSATIAKAFREAAADHEVKAIVFRVDSPGGSYVASDTIWHEVKAARDAGKPVVVSMGSVAASGGYFVAMGADRVVAEPGTITGSIGVFSGKMVLKDFWDKIGVSWDEMHRGDNATMWSFNQPFSPAAWDRMNLMLDFIYGDFTAKAKDGRKIPDDRIDSLARGRVWSGADARERGLVDALGGWDVAFNEVRALIKVPADAPLDLVAFPKPKKPWEVLANLLGGANESAELRSLTRAVRVLEPLLRTLDPQSIGELSLPPGSVPR